MNPSSCLTETAPFLIKTTYASPISKPMFSASTPYGVRFPLTSLTTKCSRADVPLAAAEPKHSSSSCSSSSSSSSSSPVIVSSVQNLLALEEGIEKAIYRFRFLAILGVFGSLIGSILCFVKGCTYVFASFMEYFTNRAKVIILLVEAIDVYLLGTVMLVFGMGLYELFVSNLDTAKFSSRGRISHRSNLFGLFTLKERPTWLEIKSVNELKTKLGHVIVMLLLIGFFEKSKTAIIHSPTDLLCFSASVFLCSVCLYMLSKLSDSK
ncbi:hypothetical protein JCGZ_06715 [Jatropha curcas]|uniref:Uncharacterized protein n=1 Tax=Jatropha curcas TaxID=180498 RepID=A0A067KS59_JATCU|nr:uncharacterized protein LOC105634409 [Jatropha curcas]KDP37813.1 hypothetical protein JCGZ_06715 [Jatropha curcas]